MAHRNHLIRFYKEEQMNKPNYSLLFFSAHVDLQYTRLAAFRIQFPAHRLKKWLESNTVQLSL